MDIICPRCSEPLDVYELHDIEDPSPLGAYGNKLTYEQARKIFFDPKKGCGFLFNGKPCEINQTEASMASAILNDFLGDDTDGVAAMLEDFGYA